MMQRLLFLLVMLLFSFNVNGAVTFSDLVQLEQGMILRGEPKAALKFTLESDAADTIYSIQLTSDVAFNASGDDITDIELYIDDGDDVYETDGSDTLFLTSTWDGSTETSVIFQNTTGVILSDTPISIIVVRIKLECQWRL